MPPTITGPGGRLPTNRRPTPKADPMNKRRGLAAAFLPVSLFIVFSCSSTEDDGAPAAKGPSIPVDEVMSFAGRQLEKTVVQAGGGDRFPRFVNAGGVWETTDSHAWSAGFFAGCLWYMYEYTGDEAWKDRAGKWTDGMEGEKYNTANHNNGFMMMPPFLNCWRLTGNERCREVLVEAARSLASRYSETVGMIKANEMERWKYPVMVDTMVNIELLFWAAENGGDPAWRGMAAAHALNTMKHHIREDGGTVQVVDFDPGTGEEIGRDTLCGLGGDSAWSRGQGQALYGFAAAYRYTKDRRFLDAACAVADYFIENLPDDAVPYWDNADPAIPDAMRDASAAAVAADGLLDLYRLVDAPSKKAAYRSQAENILASLCSPSYLADEAVSPGILDHSTWKKPADPQADTSLIWGDYYLLEALMKSRAISDKAKD